MTASGADPLSDLPPATASWRLDRAWPAFLIAGAACVVAGGLLAAATAYLTTQKTAWATAYLVLVGGVAQVALGAAVGWLRPDADRRAVWIAFAAWNLGNAGVLSGQLAAVVPVTDIGSALLVVSLAAILVVTGRRPAQRGAAAYRPSGEHRAVRHPAPLWAFRVLIVILVAGIVVGTALAHLGA
ncbi:MAG TPA: hypothetical protein VFM01_02720 [Nakamurella sp.]|nr:hypothetical protein [Nakamurella sp.]